jgi:PqqD family protein of HPr-rel-A system
MAEAINGALAPTPSHNLASVDVDGETIIYDTSSGATHLLNPTATAVWGCFDGQTTLDQMSSDLAAAYGAKKRQVRTDVVTLVRDLGRAGLLEGFFTEIDDEGGPR